MNTYLQVWQRIIGTPADGSPGPQTLAHVKAWQTSRGIEPDGIIGPLTRAALKPGDLIKPYEGCRLRTYDDYDGTPLSLDPNKQWRRPNGNVVMGYPTIAWGRRVYDYTQTCTQAQADAWFTDQLEKQFLPTVYDLGLTEDGQICAAASLAYNAGPGSLAKVAKAGYAEAVWLDYKRTKGVVNEGLAQRRREEFALFSGIGSTLDVNVG